jgi:hypothetical protein
MSVCLCLASAEKVLDLISYGFIEQFGLAGADQLAACRATGDELRRLGSIPLDLGKPVHVLVPDRRWRTCKDGITSHTWGGKLSDGALISLGGGILAASPEFNAALEMRGRTPVARALILMSYCGVFAIDEGSEDGFIWRRPLTCIDRLWTFSRTIKGDPCSAALRDAVLLAGERCRSPLEARLLLALTAPRFMGGLGLAMPRMNHRIDLSEEGRAIWGADSIEGDMVWEARKVDLEANGKLRHRGRFGEDLTRASALESGGYSVRFATARQLRSARQMLVLGRWLSEHLGCDAADLPERNRLQSLLNEINSFNYHCISLDELRRASR